MEILLYLILLFYFVLGAIITYFVNKNKTQNIRKKSWLKYFIYFLILNILFASILFKSIYYHYICVIIIIFGTYEILKNILKSKKHITGIYVLITYVVLSFFFYNYSLLNSQILFYTLFMITVFDAFSQLSGQLFGKKKIFPKISPAKTYEGLIGGFLFSIITSVLIKDLLEINTQEAIFTGIGISTFAFIGDFLASLTKRKFGIKDFSNIIPGHGGFLDRFDSLIFGSVFIFVATKYFFL